MRVDHTGRWNAQLRKHANRRTRRARHLGRHTGDRRRFSTPNALLAPINTASNEQGLILTPDELQGFLTRTSKLYYMSRTSTSAAFSAPVDIDELNAFTSPISASFVSADGCTIYFDGPDHYQLYSATRANESSAIRPAIHERS